MSALHHLWQMLPRKLRRDALFGTMALLAPRPDQPCPDGAGVLCLSGYFTARSGLGTATRRLGSVLRLAGFDPVEADLTGPLRQGPPGMPPAVPDGPGTLLVHVNSPLLPWAMHVLGRRAVAGKRVIAVWNWELPVLPADWMRGFDFAHEIWVSSHFTAAAVERPGGPPVSVLPYAVPEPSPAPIGREGFGLPPDAFVALSVFDAASSVARKNPLAAIAAHRLAFGDRLDRILLLKTHGTAAAGPSWQAVLQATAAAPNIRILDCTLGRQELWSLLHVTDCFVSLHRSEGFGLGIAEAMRAGRPVIATGWSGNMDFMAGEGAIAIPFDLVPARDPQHTYDMPEAHWAEPRIADAAAALRVVADDPARRIVMGQAAATAAAKVLSPDIVAARLRGLLAKS